MKPRKMTGKLMSRDDEKVIPYHHNSVKLF